MNAPIRNVPPAVPKHVCSWNPAEGPQILKRVVVVWKAGGDCIPLSGSEGLVASMLPASCSALCHSTHLLGRYSMFRQKERTYGSHRH